MGNYIDEIHQAIGGRSVILFGASRGARYVIEVLTSLGYSVSCVVETKSRRDDDMYASKFVDNILGIPVYGVETGLEKFPGSVVLITMMDTGKLQEIFSSFQGLPAECRFLMPEIIYTYINTLTERKISYELFDNYRYELFSSQARSICQIIAPQVTLVVTEKCNLNCQDCAAFVPMNADPVTSSFETIVTSIRNYCKSFDFVYRVCVMGGEPFLHKDINRIISEICKIENLLFVDVATNGTVIPNDRTLDTIRENGVCLEISDYGIQSRKMKELNDESDRRGVLRYHQKFNYWGTIGQIRDHSRDPATLSHHFLKCIASPTTTNHIIDGALYRCLYSGMASRLKLAPIADADYVRLDVPEESFDCHHTGRVHELSFRTKPLKTCSHCQLGTGKVRAGIQVEKISRE